MIFARYVFRNSFDFYANEELVHRLLPDIQEFSCSDGENHESSHRVEENYDSTLHVKPVMPVVYPKKNCLKTDANF